MTPVAYYLRTSSAANLHGDSETRQLAAIRGYAQQHGLKLVQGAYDQAISGADPIGDRDGLSSLIDFCREQNISTILVESAHRFARNATVQELGYLHLKSLGIQILPVDSPEYFSDDDDPTRTAIRQMLGVMSQLEKDQLVKKLKSGRIRKQAHSTEPTLTGQRKCEGRKSLWQLHPELPRLAKRIRDADQCGLKSLATKLYQLGYSSPTGSGEKLSRPAIRRLLAVAERQESKLLPKHPRLSP
jgi:DNA invertase Pin-like site-specific DNA recombinase